MDPEKIPVLYQDVVEIQILLMKQYKLLKANKLLRVELIKRKNIL